MVDENGRVRLDAHCRGERAADARRLTPGSALSAAPLSLAVAGDFELSTARTLTIAGGLTTSTGTVTITAHDKDVDAADKELTVSGTAVNGRTDMGTHTVQPQHLTHVICDDGKSPRVSLVLGYRDKLLPPPWYTVAPPRRYILLFRTNNRADKFFRSLLTDMARSAL